MMAVLDLSENTKQFLTELFDNNSEIIRKLDKLISLAKENRLRMSQFSDALAAFQAEQATLLTNIQTEIQQLLDAVNAGNTNAADIAAGLTALQAATQQAQAANAALVADDPPTPTP